MPGPTDASGLEINSDPAFQERVWRAERIAWFVGLGILVVALLGFLGGGGPFSGARAGDPEGGLEVHYERWLRHSDQTTLAFRLRPQGQAATLWLSHDFLRSVLLEHVHPEPSAVVTDREGVRFQFAAGASVRTVHVTLDVTPRSYGPVELACGTSSGPRLRLRTFVLP